MSETSIDGDAESDRFMSVPGTPLVEDDAFFSKGESVHDYLVLKWLISATVPKPRPGPRPHISSHPR